MCRRGICLSEAQLPVHFLSLNESVRYILFWSMLNIRYFYLQFVLLVYPWFVHQYVNLRRSLNTPIAVTAAPAPAPCTSSGRAPYRFVWNMMMLSDPPREVAKAWVFSYLRIHITQQKIKGLDVEMHTSLERP